MGAITGGVESLERGMQIGIIIPGMQDVFISEGWERDQLGL